ncbi:unnamed protein product, partial [Timema podura]|nr:unnamed protein product [Timema podura]
MMNQIPKHGKSERRKLNEAVPIKYNADTSAIHWLFIKEHSVQDKTAEKPAHRTLFIINVPPYCSEECLRHMLSPCGNVTAVEFHQTPTSRVSLPEHSAFFPTQLPIR